MAAKYSSLEALVSHYDISRPVNWQDYFGRKAPLEVEIGFGLGEVLMQKARQNLPRNYIGIEENWERLYKTMKTATSGTGNQLRFDLDNVKFIYEDARACFDRMFEEQSIDHVYSLFPCPWPKKSHIKHRLFSHDFLCLINSRLKNGKMLKIVTDHEPYFHWIDEEAKGAGFAVRKRTVEPQYQTKFEKKWSELGQETFYEIQCVKEQHISREVKKDHAMRTYRLKKFDPEKFYLDKVKTPSATVVFKDVVFDSGQNIMLVLVLVAEQNLSQQVRIAIIKHKDAWKVTKADGQRFFPTPGVNEAIKCVYEAASQTEI